MLFAATVLHRSGLRPDQHWGDPGASQLEVGKPGGWGRPCSGHQGRSFYFYLLASKSSGFTKPAHRQGTWADAQTPAGHGAGDKDRNFCAPKREGRKGVSKEAVAEPSVKKFLRGGMGWGVVGEVAEEAGAGGGGEHRERMERAQKAV